jgi:hypothetical protein
VSLLEKRFVDFILNHLTSAGALVGDGAGASQEFL